MKIAVIIVRILLGIVYAAGGAVVLLNLAPQPELQGATKVFMAGIEASGYLLPLIKITELICGIALLAGRFLPLATVVIFPVTLNILLHHAFLERSGLPVAVTLMAGNLFLAFAFRDVYRPLFVAKVAPRGSGNRVETPGESTKSGH